MTPDGWQRDTFDVADYPATNPDLQGEEVRIRG
jgi:hypothetical protein